MDTVAQCLLTVQRQLDEAGIKYTVSMTKPTRDLSKLDETGYYVIRQQIDMDGIYHLTAAAKMAKQNL